MGFKIYNKNILATIDRLLKNHIQDFETEIESEYLLLHNFIKMNYLVARNF